MHTFLLPLLSHSNHQDTTLVMYTPLCSVFVHKTSIDFKVLSLRNSFLQFSDAPGVPVISSSHPTPTQQALQFISCFVI